MDIKREKEFFTKGKSVFILLGIIILACAAHVNFFLKDGRPFLDHESHYFIEGFLSPLIFVYKIVFYVLSNYLPFFDYDSFFVYKMTNLFFFIPVIVFTYLSASFLYSRAFGLLAAFFVATTPDVLNIFRQSEINLISASIFSVLVYLYIYNVYFRCWQVSVCFFILFYCFFMHHYSSLLYLIAIALVAFCSFFAKARQRKDIRIKMFVLLFLLLVFFMFNFDRSMKYVNMGIHYLVESVAGERIDGFFGVYVLNWSFLYNNFAVDAGMFRLNIYMILFAVCVGFYGFSFLVRRKKEYAYTYSLTESRFIIVVLISLLFLGRGLCNIMVFFAPLYLLISVLNAGMFFKFYTKYGRFLLVKISIFIFVLLFLLYGCLSLFYPKILIRRQGREVDYYIHNSDNYNLPAHVRFIKEKRLDIGKGEIWFFNLYHRIAENIFAYDSGIINFYFLFKSQSDLCTIFDAPSDRYRYVWALYNCDVDIEDPKGIMLMDIERKVFSVLEEKELKAKYIEADLELVKILPFGLEVELSTVVRGLDDIKAKYIRCYEGKAEDLFPFRRCLVFIYKIKRV